MAALKEAIAAIRERRPKKVVVFTGAGVWGDPPDHVAALTACGEISDPQISRRPKRLRATRSSFGNGTNGAAISSAKRSRMPRMKRSRDYPTRWS